MEYESKNSAQLERYMSNSFFNAAIVSVFVTLYDHVNCFLEICKQLENVS